MLQILGSIQSTYNKLSNESNMKIRAKYWAMAKTAKPFQMTHDVNTGNLLSRQYNSNPQETFTYDNLDRLLSVNVGNTAIMTMNYADNGNIMSKSGVGSYSYDAASKPHAVSRVDNINEGLPSSSLTSEFNAFGKIRRIENEANHLAMDFQYGPDGERWYSELSDYTGSGAVSRKTMYGNDYERVIENGVTKEFYYLDGNVILIKQGNSLTPYLAFTDNLGSILSILDSNGEPVFQASYDVWGQQEVTLNEIGFHRGYTGHEMLPEFGSINMNGRLYDPVLGRFFSPDNYVQAPTNSQNFNRYSYCLNNPLKYTDPSGNIFGIDDAFFAFAVYGIASSMMQAAAFDKNVWKAGAASLLTSIGTYGIGSACSAMIGSGMSTTGVGFFKAGLHGLNSGLAASLQDENFGRAFVTGAVSSDVGSLGSNLGWSDVTKIAAMSVAGGGVAWATGGSFLDGAIRGMEIGVFNDGMHTIKLPEVECVANGQNRIIWPTITRITYNARMMRSKKGLYYSKGYYSMYHNNNLVYQCSAVSGSPTKYTIPSNYEYGCKGVKEDVYHVKNIWYRNIEKEPQFFRQGVGYTASLKEDPFIDGFTGNKREYIRIHPCRGNFTEGCIGLMWDDKNALQLNYDLIKFTLDLEPGITIPLKVNIYGR